MPSMDKLSPYHTTWSQNAIMGTGTVTYHTTEIVRWNQDEIFLNFGGWDSVTTRRKMNQAARQFGLPYSVFRDKGETFIRHPSGQVEPYSGNPVTMARN